MADGERLADAKWVEIQQKTFTRWANTYLKERMVQIKDLQKDLNDGIALINLLEIISSKSLGKYNKKVKVRSQNLENVLLSLNFLRTENIKLVNIGAEDIVDGRLKLILGLIWTIILRYQIHMEEGKSARSDLLAWVRSKIPEYNINNFSNNWNDGKALCALGNALVPGLCPNHLELNPNEALKNAILGSDNAEREMHIPKVLAPEDMVHPDVDELSVMTYISYFREWEGDEGRRKREAEIERTPVAEKCKVYGDGWEHAESGIPASFTIEAINVHGRRVPVGGHPFKPSIKPVAGGNDVQINLVDNKDGTYTGTYTAPDDGKHVGEVTLGDKHVQNSPKTINVTRGGPDATHSKAFGPGLEGAVVGEPAPFTIQSFNRLGQPLTGKSAGGDPYKVVVQGPYPGSEAPVEIKDLGNGKYDVVYHPRDHGNHVVNVTLNNQHIQKSPFNVPVSKNANHADALNCKAHGPGLQGGNTAEPSEFTVEVRNGKGELVPGNTLAASGLDVEVTDGKGNEIPNVKLHDNGDGTVKVVYETRDPGTHKVDVILRNKAAPVYYTHIKDSPFHVNVEAGSDPSKSVAFGPGVEGGPNVKDTLPTSFKIQARDREGNDIKKGGDPFDVKVHGPNGDVPAQIKDNGDGSYDVTYQPKDAGNHTVDVKLKNKPIANSPYHLNVNEGADEENSHVESYTFVIRARTKKGGNRTTGGDAFAAHVTAPNGQKLPQEAIKLRDVGDGSYVVTYSLPADAQGEYKVSVTVNGKDIKGSPWKQVI
jgi:filamin